MTIRYSDLDGGRLCASDPSSISAFDFPADRLADHLDSHLPGSLNTVEIGQHLGRERKGDPFGIFEPPLAATFSFFKIPKSTCRIAAAEV